MPSSSLPSAKPTRLRFELGLLGVALLVPVLFVLHTREIWEDFFITYRFSENLAEGRGLVFTAGERVHGFTSVLNTLLPAFFAWVTRAADFTTPLLLYRVVSLATLAFGLWAVVRATAATAGASLSQRLLVALFPLVAVLEIKTTAFTMNGQEAGLMVGFFAILVVLCHQEWPRERIVPGGCCIAGLLYTRPDAFVYVGIVGLAALALAAGSRREMAASLARSLALGILLFLPWVAFAQLYYGSFIPHTIIAKKNTLSLVPSAPGFLAVLGHGAAERLCGALAAIYDFQRDEPGAWPKWVHVLAMTLEGVAVTYWVLPRADRLGRLASLSAALVLGYLTYVGLVATCTPWYYPPLSFLSLLALWRLVVTLPALRPRAAGIAGSLVLAGTMFLLLGFVFFHSLRGLRVKQEVIDWGHRRPLGLWLKANVADQETVYLEPLGYIGYFSQRRMRDWPGLVSPEVVAARRKIGAVDSPWGVYLWREVAEEIKPDWIVARPVEEAQLRSSPYLREHYRFVRVFNVAEQIIAAGEFPGSFITYNDAVFLVFRKKPPGEPSPATGPVQPPP
ncbi:MAG TPA: hypothetical protein VG734_17550 [Lacunisphaera sp.]|nr:hypothetical protein [Lacunisphaera sp.]